MPHKQCERIASSQQPFPPHPLLAPRQSQEPAPSQEWQRSPLQLRPLPNFLQNFQSGERVCGARANDLPFPPCSPSHILPVLNEGQRCPLSPCPLRRVNLRKVKKQTCDLDAHTARQALLKQIQEGVKLKPVSPDVVTESNAEFFCSDVKK